MSDRLKEKHRLIKEQRHGMNQKLKEKVRESLASVLPITGIVLVVSVLLVPMDIGTIAMFSVGAVLLIIGMGFFQLGAEMSMTPIGEGLGVELSKTRKTITIVVVTFLVGFIITVAEPDLQVLAGQVPSIPGNVLIMTIAIGVGLFLMIAVLRVLYKVNLSGVLLVSYAILFGLTFFAPKEFLAVAFDSGGVTTGPITVPFIMAMGVGLVSLRSDKNAADDSFGLVALGSIGPILMVLLLGIFYHPTETSYAPITIPSVVTMQDVVREFTRVIPDYAREMIVTLIPIVLVFAVFQLLTHRFKRRQRIKVIVGFFYTFIGLVLFLVGVNVGFLPVGHLLGKSIAAVPYRWILIPLGMLIGYFIVKAEPAVHVLNHQVEEITNGAISHTAMGNCLSIGVSLAVGLSMLRIMIGISIMWFIVPGYIIAIALTFFVPKIFVGIAFDSGGVASGPMTSTFLLPLAKGACEAVGGNVMTDAFGVVAMVAMTPLIAVQIMGLVSARRQKRAENLKAAELSVLPDSDAIIEYEEALCDE